jgi:hypothetical protein
MHQRRKVVVRRRRNPPLVVGDRLYAGEPVCTSERRIRVSPQAREKDTLLNDRRRLQRSTKAEPRR